MTLVEVGVNRKINMNTAITSAEHGTPTQAEVGVTAAIKATTIRVMAPGDIARTTTTTTRRNTAIQVLTIPAGAT